MVLGGGNLKDRDGPGVAGGRPGRTRGLHAPPPIRQFFKTTLTTLAIAMADG